MTELLALTLWRPWPFAIFHLPPSTAKRVENRSWMPPSRVIGKRIAIHAGKKIDGDVMHGVLGDHLRDPRMLHEGIIGTAVVNGWVEQEHIQHGLSDELTAPEPPGHSESLTEAEANAVHASSWFFGPFGWVLGDVRALPEPILCRGAQGLWRVPAEIAERVLDALEKVS